MEGSLVIVFLEIHFLYGNLILVLYWNALNSFTSAATRVWSNDPDICASQ